MADMKMGSQKTVAHTVVTFAKHEVKKRLWQCDPVVIGSSHVHTPVVRGHALLRVAICAERAA